jgi:hypothetical protein
MKPPAIAVALALAQASVTVQGQGTARSDSAARVLIAPRPPLAPAYRNRIVGVWDAQTFQPLAGVEVNDLLTGTWALTSGTGNASLVFLPEGVSLVRIRKLGFESQTIPVSVSPEDSSPITILLSRMTALGPVVTAAARSRQRGPADTVRSLERNGFYDRRNSSATPPSAFLTQEKIKGLTLVSDARYVMGGRPICTANVYLDGTKLEVPSGQIGRGRVARNLKQGIDAVLPDPTTIAAIETYKWDEAPAQFAGTFSGLGALNGGGEPCITLIWTKY